MKKILTAIMVVVCFAFGISSRVYAMTTDDLETLDAGKRIQISEVYELSEFSSFDYVADCLENWAKNQYESNGKRKVWAVSTLNNHQQLKFYIFDTSVEYEEMVNCFSEDTDFVQIGGLISTTALKEIRKDFEKDPLKSALDTCVNGNDSLKERIYENIKSHNFPIYWEIKESEISTVEVAIGKYVIQKGDTLSEIATKYETTVENLLEWNSNIANPDLIYAGDYLVIK